MTSSIQVSATQHLPWERPSLPTVADRDETVVYAGVGHVMSKWESIEIQLYRIFSFFCLKPDDRKTMERYGEERIFVNRFAQLKAEAHKLFCVRHHQEIEGQFDRLAVAVEGYSGRRNDVAHGIVQMVQYFEFFRSSAESLAPRTRYWMLLPAYYKWPDHSLEAFPSYAYNSIMLNDLAARLGVLYSELAEFRERVRWLIHQK